VVIIEGEETVLGVNVGHPIVTNGPLLHSCVEVREPIELSFGLVNGWAQAFMYGMGSMWLKGKGVFWEVWPSGFNGLIFNWTHFVKS